MMSIVSPSTTPASLTAASGDVKSQVAGGRQTVWVAARAVCGITNNKVVNNNVTDMVLMENPQIRADTPRRDIVFIRSPTVSKSE